MNTKQLIEAGMALDTTQSAPQGPPVGHHARPAGSPALLLEGSAELQKVAGPHGYYIPPDMWPKPKPKQAPKPASKPAAVKSGILAALKPGILDKIKQLGREYWHYTKRNWKPGYTGKGGREDALDTAMRWGARGAGGVGAGAGAVAAGIAAAPAAIPAIASAAPHVVNAARAVGSAAPRVASAAKPALRAAGQAVKGTAMAAGPLIVGEIAQPGVDAVAGPPAPYKGWEVGETRFPVSIGGAVDRWSDQPRRRAEIDADIAAGILDASGNEIPAAQEKPMPPIDTALDKPVPPQAAPADPQLEAGAAAARGMPEPALPPSSQLEAGAAAAQAQAPPQAPPQAPQAAPGAPAAQPAPQQPPGAGPVPGAPAAPGAAPAASAAQLVWEGPVGDDAYQRALQSPMDRPQVNILTHAVNSGQIPQEQIPRAVQQIIAHNSVDKARQEAAKTGEPVEVALGRIAQQRAQGEFDAEDLTRAVPLLEQQVAEEDVAKRQAAGDQTANVEQQIEENRQDPSLMERLSAMWEGMDDGEKIGLVVGIIGSVVALANTMMGGNGMTTIVAGALGLGGLGYAFGGGDMIKKWLGSDEQAAAQAPEASKSTPVPTGEDVSVGGGAEPLGQQAAVPEIPGGAEPLGQQAAAPEIPGPDQQTAAGNQALEQILADGQVSMEELTANADVLRGMETSRLVPLIQAAPPELQNQLSSLSKMGPEVLGGAVQWAVQQSGGKLTPEDIYKMLEAYKLASPQGQ